MSGRCQGVGSRGPIGPVGPAGPRGDRGERGDPGPQCNVEQLQNVRVLNPVYGQSLVFNGTYWTNTDVILSGGSGGSGPITTLTEGDILAISGGRWVPSSRLAELEALVNLLLPAPPPLFPTAGLQFLVTPGVTESDIGVNMRISENYAVPLNDNPSTPALVAKLAAGSLIRLWKLPAIPPSAGFINSTSLAGTLASSYSGYADGTLTLTYNNHVEVMVPMSRTLSVGTYKTYIDASGVERPSPNFQLSITEAKFYPFGTSTTLSKVFSLGSISAQVKTINTEGYHSMTVDVHKGSTITGSISTEWIFSSATAADSYEVQPVIELDTRGVSNPQITLPGASDIITVANIRYYKTGSECKVNYAVSKLAGDYYADTGIKMSAAKPVGVLTHTLTDRTTWSSIASGIPPILKKTTDKYYGSWTFVTTVSSGQYDSSDLKPSITFNNGMWPTDVSLSTTGGTEWKDKTLLTTTLSAAPSDLPANLAPNDPDAFTTAEQEKVSLTGSPPQFTELLHVAKYYKGYYMCINYNFQDNYLPSSNVDFSTHKTTQYYETFFNGPDFTYAQLTFSGAPGMTFPASVYVRTLIDGPLLWLDCKKIKITDPPYGNPVADGDGIAYSSPTPTSYLLDFGSTTVSSSNTIRLRVGLALNGYLNPNNITLAAAAPPGMKPRLKLTSVDLTGSIVTITGVDYYTSDLIARINFTVSHITGASIITPNIYVAEAGVFDTVTKTSWTDIGIAPSAIKVYNSTVYDVYIEVPVKISGSVMLSSNVKPIISVYNGTGTETLDTSGALTWLNKTIHVTSVLGSSLVGTTDMIFYGSYYYGYSSLSLLTDPSKFSTYLPAGSSPTGKPSYTYSITKTFGGFSTEGSFTVTEGFDITSLKLTNVKGNNGFDTTSTITIDELSLDSFSGVSSPFGIPSKGDNVLVAVTTSGTVSTYTLNFGYLYIESADIVVTFSTSGKLKSIA